LPLGKLATFGQLRTAKGCLRHDVNVRQVFGIEGDYDDEVMIPEEAIERLERHQLKALVYTSWSHPPRAPSRVLHTFDDPQEGSCLDTLDAWQQYRIPFASHATTADQPAAPQPTWQTCCRATTSTAMH
jgi:hypothetical protein